MQQGLVSLWCLVEHLAVRLAMGFASHSRRAICSVFLTRMAYGPYGQSPVIPYTWQEACHSIVEWDSLMLLCILYGIHTVFSYPVFNVMSA